jgi:hypothetical protein
MKEDYKPVKKSSKDYEDFKIKVKAAFSNAPGEISQIKSEYKAPETVSKDLAKQAVEPMEGIPTWKGDPSCTCGSGKKPWECCFKEQRPDWHPLSTIKGYKTKIDQTKADGYASVREVDFEEATKGEEEGEEHELCHTCGKMKKVCECEVEVEEKSEK